MAAPRRAIAGLAIGIALVLAVAAFTRAERVDVCLLCGTVRTTSSMAYVTVSSEVEETDFTAWVRTRLPDHGGHGGHGDHGDHGGHGGHHEHTWVYSHTVADGEISCSESALPYFLSGLHANIGPAPEVDALLDELMRQLSDGSVDEAALLERAAQARRRYEADPGE